VKTHAKRGGSGGRSAPGAMSEQAAVVLVHGAAAGSWTWHLIVEGLRERGIDAHAPDLPSCSAPDASIDLHDDARFVRATLDKIDKPIVLVGNSYGGAVITEAAVDHARVKHLVYVAALMPRANEPIAGIIGSLHSGLTDAVQLLDDARIVFDPDVDLKASFQHAPADEQAFIKPNLGRPMSMGLDSAVGSTRVAWKTIPSTYVVCTDDLALPPEAQREWAKERATDVLEWATDHSPQHSRPDLVVELLERLVRE
jgi:pimeloyl-ACP methyl ester carboxylesterase